MKLSDINNFKDVVTNVLFEDCTNQSNLDGDKKLSSKDEGKLFTLYFDGTIFHINHKEVCRNLKLKRDNNAIFDLYKRGITVVAELIYYDKKELCFNVYPFYESLELGDTYIGLSDSIKNKLAKKGLFYSLENTNSEGPYFSELFSIEIDDKQYFLFKSPDDDDFDYKDPYELNQNNTKNETQKTSKEQKSDNQDVLAVPDFLQDIAKPSSNVIQNKIIEEHRAFTLIGNGIRTPIKIVKDENSISSKLHVKQAILQEFRNTERFGLAHGNLHFVDDSETYKLSSQVASVMEQLYESNESYLKKWDQYSKYEMRTFIKNCYAFGYAKIVNVTPTLNGYTLYLDKTVDVSLGADDDEIIVSYSVPKSLEESSNNAHAIDENIDDILKDFKDASESFRQNSSNSHYKLNKKGLNKRTEFINVSCSESDAKPRIGDYVYLSITGNLQQHNRREYAKKLVELGQCGNPLLGKLIEDNESIDIYLTATNKVDRRVTPITERITRKIFSRNPPTPTQIKAIDIALNTPDIALIQGPPGTGKTTVITAIIERINELNDKNGSIKGQILVSGFQHDAVENIIDRLSINSLPAVKFGNKRGISENDSSTTHRIENWANNIAHNIRANNPSIQSSEEEKEWEYLYNEYLLSPSEENEIVILNEIVNSKNPHVKRSTIIDEAKVMLKQYNSVEDEDYEIKHAINSLRTKKNSFADDGVDSCNRLLVLADSYSDIFDDVDIKILEKANSVTEDELPAFLSKLEELKQKLQYKVLPKPEYTQAKINYRISEMAQKVRELLKKRNENSKNEENEILVDFLSELENNPLGIRKSIEDYQLVYSATTQQSLSHTIIKAKSGKDENDKFSNPLYDTVIIDEAARANPSDLLIPMVQAEKRIILVGDHRQLPHMVDENVVDAINNNESINSDIYKISMFEYLFHRLQKLEKQDGIQRTITLDAQYRTHPLLGKFASKLFYESHNPSEAYDSPLPEKYFSQNLQAIAGKCCSWFSVANEKGPMEKNSSGSSFRVAEAEICARCIKHWIDSPEAEGLSFGIITFYSAQVLEIMKQLEKYDIVDQDIQTKEYKIKEEYRYLKNGKERLRIGSVDAFQGMEFDIVLLSLVRSMSQDYIEKTMSSALDRERAVNKIVGFLKMENRLCVSMSRQKRFLGIVGDSQFINSEVCKENVPSLSRFYELCASVGGLFKC